MSGLSPATRTRCAFRPRGAAQPELQARQAQVRLEDGGMVDEQRLVDARGDLQLGVVPPWRTRCRVRTCPKVPGWRRLGDRLRNGAQLLERAAGQAEVDVDNLRGLEGLDGRARALHITEILQRPQRQVTTLRGDLRELTRNVALFARELLDPA